MGSWGEGPPGPLAAASPEPAAARAPQQGPWGGFWPFSATRGKTGRRTEISSAHLSPASARGCRKAVPGAVVKSLSAAAMNAQGDCLIWAKWLSSLVPVVSSAALP